MSGPFGMARRIHLPPTIPDVAVAKFIAERASAPVEHYLKLVTFLADEKVLLAAATMAWGVAKLARRPAARRSCNHLLACTLASTMIPHLMKLTFERERPDRCVVPPIRHGIPRSGNPFDSFPSGHALHLGALAAASGRLAGRRWYWAAWPFAIGLASTRLLLLAHWLTDVAAGLALGAALERAIATFCGLVASDSRSSHEPEHRLSRFGGIRGLRFGTKRRQDHSS
jgi:membrane-associated phospholipid phosphatase